jgi:hypothetical protein
VLDDRRVQSPGDRSRGPDARCEAKSPAGGGTAVGGDLADVVDVEEPAKLVLLR